MKRSDISKEVKTEALLPTPHAFFAPKNQNDNNLSTNQKKDMENFIYRNFPDFNKQSHKNTLHTIVQLEACDYYASKLKLIDFEICKIISNPTMFVHTDVILEQLRERKAQMEKQWLECENQIMCNQDKNPNLQLVYQNLFTSREKMLDMITNIQSRMWQIESSILDQTIPKKRKSQ